MDLWCNESSSPVQQPLTEQDAQPDAIVALVDPNLLADARVLQRLLLTELRCLPREPDFVFNCVQREVRPHMRKILTSWMLEVSDGA